MANVPNGIIDPYSAVTACGSSDNSTRLEARIYNGSIEIGYVISGTYTVFGSPLTTSVNKGGAWSLKVDPATRKIDLLHDNAIAHTVTDSGGLAQFDMVGINDYTANLWSGCAHYCGNSFFPFTFVLVQLSAPDFGSFVTYEIV
jgi:hypothetical protein